MSFRSLIFSIISLALVGLASYLMLLGSGFFNPPTVTDTLLFVIVILLLNSSKKAFYFLLLPIVLAYALYTPIGLTFGAPSYQYVASVFATDVQESKEFFTQIPLPNYLACVAILCSIGLFRIITQRYRLQFAKNRLFLTACSLFIFTFTPPFKFLNETYTATMKVKDELARLNSLTIKSQWGDSQLVGSRYDDYVLIIGESARKDYHHAYGYPVENTPFMSNAKGTLIDGFTSGGTNTIASLKLMLTKPDTQKWEGDYTLTLVDLIKSAGIKTYWLSNQGYLGTYDTPISSIANKSNEKLFLKAGDSLNQNISDFALLPKFDSLIQQSYPGKRFIVVHLYGSHPVTCDRLTDYPKLFDEQQLPKKYHNVNCYVSSIKKTDEVIKKIYHSLVHNEQINHRSFSMIYFSDHGLAHQISEDNIVIHNSSGKSKLHFDIPLFKISSDDTERKEYKVFKSGLNFTEGIAKWVGISNPKLNAEIDLFSNQADKSDYGLKQIIEKFEGEIDPAVIIPTK